MSLVKIRASNIAPSSVTSAKLDTNIAITGTLTVSGNLTASGTTTTVNSTTLDIADLNITVAKGAVNAAAANGAGLTVDGAGATLLYSSSTDSWTLNKGLNVTGTLQVNGVSLDSRYLQLNASFSGDVTGTYSATTLANSGVAAGTYGSTSAVPQITVDAKGRITSVSSVNISSLGDTVISSSGTSAALRITQTGTGNALLVEDSANPDSSPFVVDASGSVGVGGTPSAGQTLKISKNITGAVSSVAIRSDGAIQSDVTTEAVCYQTVASLQATAFTLANLTHYQTNQVAPSGGAVITNQFGYQASSSLTGATNNYGFYSNIASGTGRWNFYANGTADNYFAGNVGIGLAPVANNGILQLGNYGSVKALMETATVSATAATGTINYDAATQAVVYYTSNASANWTVNFRGSASLSLNSMMQTGQSLTLAFLVTQGATAYYNSAVQVDGASITPKWQGGTAPTSGNASSIDVYSYTVVKTASATFTVFASQTKFA